MIRGLNSSTESELDWLAEFAKGTDSRSHDTRTMTLTFCLDFRRRFSSLLSYKFREFGSVTALSILEAANSGIKTLAEDKSKG
jgi:N-acetyltransferase 10